MATAIFDADSHVMETGDWLAGFAEPDVREQLGGLGFDGAGAGAKELMDRLPGVWASHRDQEIGADVIAGPKGWLAPGALDTDVRSRVLDALGIDAQLVFPTFAVEPVRLQSGPRRALRRHPRAEPGHDRVLRPRPAAQGGRLAAPRRPRAGRDDARRGPRERASRPCGCPPRRAGDRSPAHLDFDGVWARLAEAGVPFVLHVGGGKLLPKAFHNNGQPRPKDWLGGGENLRAKDFPVLHHSPERFLACMAIDGVFERHEQLRGAAIELGASWVPTLLRNLDHAHRSFAKHEPALRDLPLLPSEYIRRQVRFTPFPFEDTAWLIEQCGPELFMFSTDYPHPEGGRRPFEIFGDALSAFDDDAQERFFWRNGAELLGLT